MVQEELRRVRRRENRSTYFGESPQSILKVNGKRTGSGYSWRKAGTLPLSGDEFARLEERLTIPSTRGPAGRSVEDACYFRWTTNWGASWCVVLEEKLPACPAGKKEKGKCSSYAHLGPKKGRGQFYQQKRATRKGILRFRAEGKKGWPCAIPEKRGNCKDSIR